MSVTPIRNIIFDLGAVLINIDYQLTMQAFARLGFNPSVQFTRERQSGIFNRFEKGQITAADFLDELRAINGKPVTDNELVHAWNAMVLDMPMHRFRMLEALRTRYRIFLLSNTNAIHIEAVWTYMDSLLGPGRWHSYFDKAYYSHLMGMRKPDHEIYAHVLKDAGIRAGETLFLDDSPQNLDGAAALGIRTLHITGEVSEQLSAYFAAE